MSTTFRVQAEEEAAKWVPHTAPFVEGDKEEEADEPTHDGDHTGGGPVGQIATEPLAEDDSKIELVDAKGRPVPESIREVFADSGEEFRAIIRTIGDAKKCIEKLRKEPGGERRLRFFFRITGGQYGTRSIANRRHF